MICYMCRVFQYKTPLAQACSLCQIQNSQFSPHPTRPTCRTRPTIQNSEFTIHNLPIPLALFRAHYRLKKCLSLWWIKKISGQLLLKIVSLFCERLILKLYSPPLARACSSCPIHNSQFPPVLPVPFVPLFASPL